MAEIVSFRKDNNNSGDGALVLRQLSGGILRLTLNNPPANALSISTMETLMGELWITSKIQKRRRRSFWTWRVEQASFTIP